MENKIFLTFFWKKGKKVPKTPKSVFLALFFKNVKKRFFKNFQQKILFLSFWYFQQCFWPKTTLKHNFCKKWKIKIFWHFFEKRAKKCQKRQNRPFWHFFRKNVKKIFFENFQQKNIFLSFWYFKQCFWPKITLKHNFCKNWKIKNFWHFFEKRAKKCQKRKNRPIWNFFFKKCQKIFFKNFQQKNIFLSFWFLTMFLAQNSP